MIPKSPHLTRFGMLFLAMVAIPANAAIIASTTFDGRTLGTTLVDNDTASGLNWTTNGVADPGSLSARQWGGSGQGLFNGNSLVQNMFAPALNVGNAPNDDTRSWVTEVSLSVLPGFIVSVESVSFDYWAVNGSQAQNVNRNSDFVVTLFDPNSVSLATVSINDVINGTDTSAGAGTPVMLSFDSSIALSEPGTYTLQIRAGDIDDNETGNHTAIDNLSILGTAIPEPSTALMGLAGLALILLRRR